MIDVHAHIQFDVFKKERDDILKKMSEIGMKAIVVGTKEKTSIQAIQMAKENKNIFATVGVHPLEESGSIFDFEDLCKEAVAIGECGFDYTRTETLNETKELQKNRFQEHIKVALKYNLPLMMHIRTNKEDVNTNSDAHKDFIEEFSKAKEMHPNLHAHIHFYTEARVAEELLDLGCTFSFSGVITFVKEYEKAVEKIPLDRLMLETDCPYASPEPKRRTKNIPMNVEHIADKVAEIHKVSIEKVIEMTDKNAIRIFKLN